MKHFYQLLLLFLFGVFAALSEISPNNIGVSLKTETIYSTYSTNSEGTTNGSVETFTTNFGSSSQTVITFDDRGYSHAQELNNFSLLNGGITFLFTSKYNANPDLEYRTNLNINSGGYTAGAVMFEGTTITLATFKTSDGPEFDL
ncbi:hypothetical protein ACFCT7_03990 [Fulvivirgaceae bacterium LMO-SS25]